MHTSIVCVFNMACRVLIARICMALNSLSPRIKKNTFSIIQADDVRFYTIYVYCPKIYNLFIRAL